MQKVTTNDDAWKVATDDETQKAVSDDDVQKVATDDNAWKVASNDDARKAASDNVLSQYDAQDEGHWAGEINTTKRQAKGCSTRSIEEMPHTRYEPNLLAARFHNDLSFDRTKVFLVASGCMRASWISPPTDHCDA